MPRRVNTAKRPYRSVVRAEQAQATRTRILEAARTLFLGRGYAGTTVAAVAESAEVAPETVYLAFANKRGLLEGVIDASILGPDGPLPLLRQRGYVEIPQIESPTERLRACVHLLCDVLTRTSPVHAVIRGAADAEEFAVDLRRRLREVRLATITEMLRSNLAGFLRPGLTFKKAGERFGALASPELFHLTTVELGWSVEQYQEWLTELLTRDLLDSRPHRDSSAGRHQAP